MWTWSFLLACVFRVRDTPTDDPCCTKYQALRRFQAFHSLDQCMQDFYLSYLALMVCVGREIRLGHCGLLLLLPMAASRSACALFVRCQNSKVVSGGEHNAIFAVWIVFNVVYTVYASTWVRISAAFLLLNVAKECIAGSSHGLVYAQISCNS